VVIGILGLTGGICPIARCSKSLLNGPCGGGSEGGKCEVNPEIQCAWQLIYDRLTAMNKLNVLLEINSKKLAYIPGWRPRKIVREDLRLGKEEE
jgi:hypothetical protein